ncbi:MAG: hypothetical protein ACRDQZ_14045, partial [Mycobacteriales bacterium]
TGEERKLLVACLRGHPAVTTAMCRLLNSGALSQQDVHDALIGGESDVLLRVPNGHGRTLGSSLTTLTEELAKHDALADDLLAVLVHLPTTRTRAIAAGLLSTYAQAASLKTGPPAHVRLRCSAAITALKDFRLISSRPGTGISIHPLTRAVLRAIYRPRRDNITTGLADTADHLDLLRQTSSAQPELDEIETTIEAALHLMCQK